MTKRATDMTIEVARLADLRADELNPREQVDERLAAVALSLAKFGHVLPLFVDDENRICSGHQRSEAARSIGATVVPIVRLRSGDHLHRASRLTLFNLATNDQPDRSGDGLIGIGDKADIAAVIAALDALPDIPDIDDPNNWPCFTARDSGDDLTGWDLPTAPVAALLDANPDVSLGAPEGFEGARSLARPPFSVIMPIVVDKSLRLVCGRQRLIAAGIMGRENWPIVTVDDDRYNVDQMRVALNDLSMRYDLTGYTDVLRASVWLNHVRRRINLGIGFIHWVAKSGAWAKDFDIRQPENAQRWRDYHGTYVADIGAGHLIETGMLTKYARVRSVAFEPFIIDDEAKPDRDLTRKMTAVFLDEIAQGRPFDSVFVSAVLNQVPFEEDRFRVLSLAHALCGPKSAAYVTTQSTGAAEWKYFEAGRRNSRHRNYDLRLPGPEPRTVISAISMGRVMVTKYHTADELRHLLQQLWRTVRLEEKGSSLFARCTDPRPVDPVLVAKMIAHEFDLPWGDGQTLGMVDEARAAFEKRLGVALPIV